MPDTKLAYWIVSPFMDSTIKARNERGAVRAARKYWKTHNLDESAERFKAIYFYAYSDGYEEGSPFRGDYKTEKGWKSYYA